MMLTVSPSPCASALRSTAFSRASMTAASSSLRTKASAPVSSARISAPSSSDRGTVNVRQYAVDQDRRRPRVRRKPQAFAAAGGQQHAEILGL